jgi:hypothetical protein
MSTSRVFIAKPADETVGEYSISGYDSSSIRPIVSDGGSVLLLMPRCRCQLAVL